MDVPDVCDGETATTVGLGPDPPVGQLFAYSETADEPVVDVPERRRYTLPVLLLVLAAGAVIVTSALFVDRLERRDAAPIVASPSTEAVTSSSAEVYSPTPVALPSVTASIETAAPPVPAPDADTVYLAALARAGFKPTNPAGAIGNGHSVCTYLAKGHTAQEAVISVNTDSNNTMTVPMAYAFVHAAIDAYCPQYK